jgi:hypothetical protein
MVFTSRIWCSSCQTKIAIAQIHPYPRSSAFISGSFFSSMFSVVKISGHRYLRLAKLIVAQKYLLTTRQKSR